MADSIISPLAPEHVPALSPLPGVRLAAVNCGIRYKHKPDVLLVELAEGTAVAGVFTRSLTASASVEWCRAALATGKGARVLVANSGNANAFTGKHGVEAVEQTVAKAAAIMGCAPEQVFVASTGVIGELLPYEKLTNALPDLHAALNAAAWGDAISAIMTTDTFRKSATRKVMIGQTEVTLQGIAKGSGMIAPDMATMFGFLFTDAALPQPVLQQLIAELNAISFNAITVDSDTSTSDTLLAFATGQAQHAPVLSVDDVSLAAFKVALREVMVELAQLIVKDGEGATKFITIQVTGAASDMAARRIGLAIGNSPLVKTAIAGEDANWGRIVMAIGKSGEKADRDRLRIHIGDALVACDGGVNPDYVEAPTAVYMKGQNIRIAVDVGVGQGSGTVWTCDLTHRYIDINGSYRS